jgi:hypothetical protein
MRLLLRCIAALALITFFLMIRLPNQRPELIFAFALLSFVVFATHQLVGGFLEGYREAEKDLRKLEHRCLLCGYRLCGNESGICPECGTPHG